MPKRKQNQNQHRAGAGTNVPAPAPIFNPLQNLSQEARFLLIQQIDQQIAGLEKTANELTAVRLSLTAAGVTGISPLSPLAGAAQQNIANIGVGKDRGKATFANTDPNPKSEPAKKRGRPPGSKNKPKANPQTDSPAVPADTPAASTQDELFAEGVDATRPERDEEFRQAS
jgi:hypothetical protein